jgi:hypothetical protein
MADQRPRPEEKVNDGPKQGFELRIGYRSERGLRQGRKLR